MYSDNARSTTIGISTNPGGNKKNHQFYVSKRIMILGLSQSGQTRSLSNRGTMPSPPRRQGSGKGSKSSEPLRPLNLNQQRSSRRFNQQSLLTRFNGRDYSYGNQWHSRQQDYYNDYISNRRNNNGYAGWPRQPQRFIRQLQNYNESRFYQAKRRFN